MNVQNIKNLNVNCHAVNHVPFVAGQLQKKGLRPIVKSVNSVKGGTCVDQLPFVEIATNVHSAGLSSHGKPGEVMEFHFFQAWKSHGKLLQVLENS